MYFKVARTVNLLVVVLMSFEILGASIMILPLTSRYDITLYSEELPSSLLDVILFEKAEEENEKTEEEKHCLSRAILVDLSLVKLSLSAYHSPHIHLEFSTSRYEVRPPIHQLNCVFLI